MRHFALFHEFHIVALFCSEPFINYLHVFFISRYPDMVYSHDAGRVYSCFRMKGSQLAKRLAFIQIHMESCELDLTLIKFCAIKWFFKRIEESAK